MNIIAVKQLSLNKFYYWLLCICVLCNATALFSDILGPDATLYASISKTITYTNDWVNLYGNGSDWLDKPHLPFWLAAISFKFFGINAFAYKLPNFLAYLFTCYYLYKLTNNNFSKQMAQMATLIFASSLHIILCNFDVRAEIFLTLFILAATYHFLNNINSKFNHDTVLTALFAACAIMTKGIFVLITISFGFIVYWIITKQYKQFFNFKWYVLLTLIFVFIVPELYCLYTQFDLHPEKIVFGKTNVSGIKFFFWDSQFGRFFNNGPITGESEKLFFVHTTFWAFLPWSIALVFGIIFSFVKKKFLVKPVNKCFFILNVSALITFVVFNVSQFQLPHYIVIIFPHFAIIVANYLLANESKKRIKVLLAIHLFLSIVVVTVTIIMSIYLPINAWWFIVAFIVFYFIIYYQYWGKTSADIFIAKGVILMFFLGVFLNQFYFPRLMQYQGGMNAGKFQQRYMPTTKAYMYKCNDYNFEFYGNSFMNRIESLQSFLLKPTEEILIFANKNSLFNINTDSFKVNMVKPFADFHISEMKIEFINQKSRKNVIDTFYLATCTRLK